MLKTDAGRMFAVHKHSHDQSTESLLPLNRCNHKDVAVDSKTHSADRLAHLKLVTFSSNRAELYRAM